jgi:hypothetical protein
MTSEFNKTRRNMRRLDLRLRWRNSPISFVTARFLPYSVFLVLG